MLARFEAFIGDPIDLRPIGLYRIGLGFIISILLMTWAPHWSELFSNEGFHLGPLASWAPSPIVCLGLGIVLSISTLMMTIGLLTRSATGVTLMIFTFLYGIDFINERALSSIIVVSLTIGFFSPWGDYLSLTSYRRSREAPSASKYLGNPIFTRLWQMQLLQMYFFSGLIKTMYPSWLDGSVLKQIFMGRWSRELGLWLSSVLPDYVYPILTIGTITLELLFPLLFFFKKTRLLAVLLGLLFHLFIQVTLYIEYLGIHSMLCLIVFFWPQGRWDYRPKLFSWIEHPRISK